MSQRTRHFQLRLSLEEAERIKQFAKDYSSVSDYIRCAVKEYSNVNAKMKMELMGELGQFYRKYWDELSWMGGNLNQAMKRANELAIAGLLTPAYFKEILIPLLESNREKLIEIKNGLDKISRKINKT